MPRKRVKAPPPTPTAVGMREWVDNAVVAAVKRRSKPPRVDDKAMKKATDQAATMAKTGDWSGATGRHFVALYVHGHELTYGVEPVELSPEMRVVAAAMAKRMLDKHFASDNAAVVKYMDWAWADAKRKDRWCEENGRTGGRLTWRTMFGGHSLTDYLRSRLDRRSTPPGAK